MSPQRAGLLHGVLAFSLWGVVPAYWKLISGIDALELIAHRALWGLLTFLLIVAIARRGAELRTALRDMRTLGMMALSGTLLAINWSVFVAATLHGYLLEASLGYFINPLVSIALGTLVLHERIRRLQWVAIALALVGVTLMIWHTGRVPWVSLVLAVTWGFYGLVRKLVRVDVLVGSTIETILFAPVAIAYIIVIGGGSAAHADGPTLALVAGTGVITAVPLVLFTSAARRLPLSTTGFLQFIAPSGQFLLAVFAYGERLAHARLLAFIWIWAGLAVFSFDLARNRAKVAG